MSFGISGSSSGDSSSSSSASSESSSGSSSVSSSISESASGAATESAADQASLSSNPDQSESPAPADERTGASVDKFSLPENTDARAYSLAAEADTDNTVPTVNDTLCSAPEKFGRPEYLGASDSASDTSAESTRGTVTVKPGQSILGALSAAGVQSAQLSAAYGSLLSSGQLQAAEFKDSSPVVQPGRQFDVDTAQFTPSNAALGAKLIRGETAAKLAAQNLAMPALNGNTLNSQDAGQPQTPPIAAVSPKQQPSPTAVAPNNSFSDQYNNVLGAWGDVKKNLRESNDAIAVSDNGGVITAAVAFTTAPRELGFKLIDAGLSLGSAAASVYGSARNGTLVQDAKDTFGPAVGAFAAGFADANAVRISASLGDAKVMLGTDRVGVQYKTKGDVVDGVTRLTHTWGDEGFKTELMLEKNFVNIKVPVKPKVGGMPLNITVVPGARQNLTGSQKITPSTNIELGVEGNKNLPKVAIEFRKFGS
jgi:hypothetical protein